VEGRLGAELGDDLRLAGVHLAHPAQEGGEAARKRRRDAEGAFRDAGRAELAAQEAREGALIDAYLPSQLSDAELDALVRVAIDETGAQSPRDMGRAIQHAMTAAEGRAEGARVSARVKEALAA